MDWTYRSSSLDLRAFCRNVRALRVAVLARASRYRRSRNYSPAASNRQKDNFGFEAAEKSTDFRLDKTVAMAKNKGRRSTGGETSLPNGAAAIQESAPAEDSLPNLDESALANLTKRIEQRLKDGNGTPKKDQKKSKDDSVNEGKKGKKDRKDKKDERKNPAKQDSNKGKKRDRNGDVISREEKEAGKKNKDEANDALRQEILALGGSKEDFDLIAGVDSDSEVEGQNITSAKSKDGNSEDALRKELSKMLEGAGHIVPKDIEQDEEQEEDDSQGDDDEEGSDQSQEISDVEEDIPEDVSPPAPSKAEKEAFKKESTAKNSTKNETEMLPKAYSKLVCVSGTDLLDQDPANSFIDCSTKV